MDTRGYQNPTAAASQSWPPASCPSPPRSQHDVSWRMPTDTVQWVFLLDDRGNGEDGRCSSWGRQNILTTSSCKTPVSVLVEFSDFPTLHAALNDFCLCNIPSKIYLLVLLTNAHKVRALVARLCPTLCDPMDCCPRGSVSMGFSRQEYWSRLLLPYPGDLPDPGITPRSPALQADSLPSEPPGKPHKCS